MTAISLGLLLFCIIAASVSMESRNVSTELTSSQITTVNNGSTKILTAVWNTKSMNTIGWVSESDSYSLWACRTTKTFMTVIHDRTLSHGGCYEKAVVLSELVTACSGTYVLNEAGGKSACPTVCSSVILRDDISSPSSVILPGCIPGRSLVYRDMPMATEAFTTISKTSIPVETKPTEPQIPGKSTLTSGEASTTNSKTSIPIETKPTESQSPVKSTLSRGEMAGIIVGIGACFSTVVVSLVVWRNPRSTAEQKKARNKLQAPASRRPNSSSRSGSPTRFQEWI